MLKLFILASLLLLTLSGQPAQACVMPFVRSLHNQTVDGFMVVRPGKRCHITFRSGGPTESTHIVQRPSHGSVSLGAIGRVTYQPHAGFAGNDMFIYQRRGLDARNNPSVRTVRVNVTVR